MTKKDKCEIRGDMSAAEHLQTKRGHYLAAAQALEGERAGQRDHERG